MKTPILIIAMTMAAGLTITDAAAQAREPMDFATLDADGNGQITLEDFEATRAARFAEIDGDGDGALSEAELMAHAQAQANDRAAQMATRMIDRMDANDDGVLQPEEMQDARGDGLARRFDRLDADEDGAISEDEFQAARDDRGERHHGGKGNGPRPGRG